MKAVYLIIALVVVVGGIVLFTGGNSNTSAPSEEEAMIEKEGEAMMEKEEGAMMKETVITYTADGFSPQAITIKKGDKVTWKNNSSLEMWPASAMHPTHTVYPGSGITKCGTAEEANIFDACSGVPVGGSYSFTFNEIGQWNYHDHLTLGKFGSITVEE